MKITIKEFRKKKLKMTPNYRDRRYFYLERKVELASWKRKKKHLFNQSRISEECNLSKTLCLPIQCFESFDV